MPRPHNKNTSLSLVSLHDFSACKLTLLKDFSHVSTFITPKQTANAGFTLPTNKGKLSNAINGEISLISLAYEVRVSVVILPKISK